MADGTERERVVLELSAEKHVYLIRSCPIPVPNSCGDCIRGQRRRDRALIRAALEAAADELERIVNAQPQPLGVSDVAMRFYGAVRALHEHPEAVLAKCVGGDDAG